MNSVMDKTFLAQIISKLNNANQQSDELKSYQVPKCIQFTSGDPPIILFDENKGVYSSNDCENYNSQALQAGNLWHLVLIQHNGQFLKEDILEGLFDVVDGELFIPIAYRRGPNIDYFFVSREFPAMKKIFDRKLLIPVKDRSLQAVIKVGIAECQENQRFYQKFNAVITERVKNSSTLGGSKELNLNKIDLDPKLREMCVNLGNTGTLDLVLNALNRFAPLKRNSNFRTFKFASNGIKDLSPFQHLYDFQMDVLDLSFNKIQDVKEIEKLKFLNVQELYLKGNDCCKDAENLERIREILPELRKLDEITVAARTLYKTNIKGDPTKIGNKPIPSKSIKDGIVITAKNRSQFLKNLYGIRDDKYWSKVVIHHDDKYTLLQVLRKLAKDVCQNSIIYPCYPKRFRKRDEFYVYKNFDALKIMIQSNLKFAMNPEALFNYTIDIHMNVAEFEDEETDWSENLKYIISRRIQKNKLNLNAFVEEELLSNMFTCLENYNNLNFILDQARLVNNMLTEIHMESCGISGCEGFFILQAFQKLRLLNLRNNKIEKLEGIRRNTVVEVFLDGNPICDQDPVEYIASVSNYFSHLEFLDGHRVHPGNALITFQNYLVTIDVYTLVDEFIKHFFTLWDSFERPQLKQMYKKNSMLSICINYEYNKSKDELPFSEMFPRIQKYVSYDRNLKKISDVSKAINKIYVGVDEINRIMNDLPPTKHNLTNCNIDVPYFDTQKSQIIIIVSGFMEDLTNNQSFLLAFTRTFTLVSQNSEFFITNDQILLRNPTDIQRDASNESIQSAKYNDLVENCLDLLPTDLEERTLKLVLLQELTKCKKEFCLQLLEEKFWDFKVALACFNVDMSENKVPDEVFNFK